MQQIKQLKCQIKQIIIRFVKENINKHTIYFIVENYINNYNFDDNMYECIVDNILNQIHKINPNECITENLKKEKHEIIEHFKFFKNKTLLSSPCKILGQYDFHCKKYMYLVDENFVFFNSIYTFIDKIQNGYGYTIH